MHEFAYTAPKRRTTSLCEKESLPVVWQRRRERSLEDPAHPKVPIWVQPYSCSERCLLLLGDLPFVSWVSRVGHRNLCQRGEQRAQAGCLVG